MVSPIKPSQVKKARAEKFPLPDETLEVFNDLIAKHWDGSQSRIWQDKAVKELCLRLNCKSDHLFKNKMLDVVETYRMAGWWVTYDKPGYCESYEASWTFKKR